MNGPHVIILACDDTYAYCAAVAMTSIIRHTDSNLDFILLDDGISETRRQELASCIRCRPGISLRFMDMAPLVARFPDELFSCREYWQRSTYFRLFCARPGRYRRIVPSPDAGKNALRSRFRLSRLPEFVPFDPSAVSIKTAVPLPLLQCRSSADES